MPSGLEPFSGRQLQKWLRSLGAELIGQTGGHQRWELQGIRFGLLDPAHNDAVPTVIARELVNALGWPSLRWLRQQFGYQPAGGAKKGRKPARETIHRATSSPRQLCEDIRHEAAMLCLTDILAAVNDASLRASVLPELSSIHSRLRVVRQQVERAAS